MQGRQGCRGKGRVACPRNGMWMMDGANRLVRLLLPCRIWTSCMWPASGRRSSVEV